MIYKDCWHFGWLGIKFSDMYGTIIVHTYSNKAYTLSWSVNQKVTA